MDRKKFMKKFFFKNQNEKSIAKFDEFVLDDFEKAQVRAKLLLGIDEQFVNEFNPIVVSTPAVADDLFEPILVYGEDRIRYDIANFDALFFGKDTLFYYSCVIDHKTGASLNDTLVELPYSKVLSLETYSRFEEINGQNHHVFELGIVVSENESINLTLRLLLVDDKTKEGDYLIQKDLLEVSSDLKAFLRTKIK